MSAASESEHARRTPVHHAMTRESPPDDGRGASVDSADYDSSYTCGDEDAHQQQESGAAQTASTATAEIESLKAQLAKANSVAADAITARDEMRTEHRQRTSAESPVTRTAASVTAAARESKSTANRAITLLKICKAEHDG